MSERSPRPLRLHLRLGLYLSFNTLTVLGALWFAPPTLELILVALASYYVRMFAVTAVYHRLFAHRSYTPRNRVVQFVLALWALTSAQRGPIWWATTHRWHHRHADTALDLHSPSQQGLWESHILLGVDPSGEPVLSAATPGRPASYPELEWLDRPGATRHGHRPGEWDPTGALITLWWRLGLVTRLNPGPTGGASGGPA